MSLNATDLLSSILIKKEGKQSMAAQKFRMGDFIALRDRNRLTWIEILFYLKRGAHEIACDFDEFPGNPIYLQCVALERDIDEILADLKEGEANDTTGT